MNSAGKNNFFKSAGFTALALLIWTFSSNTFQDILVFGVGFFSIYKVWRTGKGLVAWRQPAGLAFIAVVLYMLISLPFSTAPADSWHDFSDMLEVFAGAFAIPVIFNTRARLESALWHSANAITITLVWDLSRLGIKLGSDIMALAHSYQPFILNHSNVASSMAGLAALVYIYFAWKNRRSWISTAICLIGFSLCVLYQIVLASRGPQLALLATLFALGALLPGWKLKSAWLGTAAFFGVMVIINATAINPRLITMGNENAQPVISAKLETKDFTADANSIVRKAELLIRRNLNQRDIVWTHTWKLIRQRIWFGHGFGKSNFTTTYYRNNPPPADYYYPHPHQYWLKVMFEFGLIGALLHLTAWLILAWQLIRRICAEDSFTGRLWPGVIGLMLLCIHVYGLGDYPDNIVRTAQIWLIPTALLVIAERAPERRKSA